MFRVGCCAALLDDAAAVLAAADHVFADAAGVGAVGSSVLGANDLDVGQDVAIFWQCRCWQLKSW